MDKAKAKPSVPLTPAERNRIIEEQQRYMAQRFGRATPRTSPSRDATERPKPTARGPEARNAR